jgi:hypothetical protein
MDRHVALRRPASARAVTTHTVIVDELLRADRAAHVFGLRWNLLLASAGTLVGAAWFAATQARTTTQHR